MTNAENGARRDQFEAVLRKRHIDAGEGRKGSSAAGVKLRG